VPKEILKKRKKKIRQENIFLSVSVILQVYASFNQSVVLRVEGVEHCDVGGCLKLISQGVFHHDQEYRETNINGQPFMKTIVA
jgi:hypothetical protein